MTALGKLLLGGLLLALAGCGAEVASDAAAPGATSKPVTAAAAGDTPALAVATADSKPAPSMADAKPQPLGEFRIVSVLLGRALDAEHVVVSESEVFSRRDPIHASVLSTGASQGVNLTATWLGPGGVMISETSQPIVPTTATATTFSVRNRQAWPIGDYRLLIAVNGRAAQEKQFKVR